MSSDELSLVHRRDSWPPTIWRMEEDEMSGLDDIDANPFAYFLAIPPMLDEDLDDFSAGIESDEDVLPEIRDVSPSSLQRDLSDSEDDPVPQETTRPTTPLLSLKDFAVAHTSNAGRRVSHRETDIGVPKPSMAARGRATLKEPRRGRGRTRSLSSQSSHSWREPSADVWSIPEEDEDVDDTVLSTDWQKYQGHLEGSLHESAETPLPEKKPKKTVRWALP